MFVCMSICVYVCVHMFLYVCICISIYVLVFMRLDVCWFVWVGVCGRVRLLVCVYVFPVPSENDVDSVICPHFRLLFNISIVGNRISLGDSPVFMFRSNAGPIGRTCNKMKPP